MVYYRAAFEQRCAGPITREQDTPVYRVFLSHGPQAVSDCW